MMAMEVPLEVIAEQLGHASIRVTKDVYGHLMPRSRARAAEAMRTILFDEESRETMSTESPNVQERLAVSEGLAVTVAVNDSQGSSRKSLTSSFVGRPGLDPGTLGPQIEGPRTSR